MDISSLVVEDQGEGAPLVLLHGFAGDRHTWDGVFASLAKSRRVIRYDLRGFGASPPASEPYDHADDLLALLSGRGIDACDLMGVSMGAAHALHFALENPRRVNRLVLASPAILGWDWSPRWRALWAELQRAAKEEGAITARTLWLKHPMFASLTAHKEAFAAFSKTASRYTCRHWLGEDRHTPLERPDLEQLADLDAPTLLLSGAQDMEDFRLIAEAIAQMAPNVTRVDIKDAGHMAHLERPQRFLKEVSAFLDRA